MNDRHYMIRIMDKLSIDHTSRITSGLIDYNSGLMLRDRIIMYMFTGRLSIVDIFRDTRQRTGDDIIKTMKYLVANEYVSKKSYKGTFTDWYYIELKGEARVQQLINRFMLGSVDVKNHRKRLEQNNRIRIKASNSRANQANRYNIDDNTDPITKRLFDSYLPIVKSDIDYFNKIRICYNMYITIDSSPEDQVKDIANLINDPDKRIVLFKHTPMELCLNAAKHNDNMPLFETCFREFIHSETIHNGKP